VESAVPSLRRRIALAVALTVAFYVLALSLVAALATQPLWTWALLDWGNLWLTAVCELAALAILRAVLPRRQGYEPPGPALTREAQPELRAFLDDVARRVGDRPVDEVYLAPGVDVAVMEVPRRRRDRDRAATGDGDAGAGDRRYRRVLHLGLPVLQVVDREALAAIIAHEHGHYVGGDTRTVLWIGRTSMTLDRTVERLKEAERWLQNMMAHPFQWYRSLFLRITGAVSRREETAADALAARTAGAEAHARALVTLRRAGMAFPAFVEQDLEPALAAGVHPPVAEGFARMLVAPGVPESLEDAVRESIAEQRPDPHATHPTTAERLAALGIEDLDAVAPAPEGEPTAITLLRDVQELERGLLTDADAMRPVAWEEVGDLAIVEHARRLVAANTDLLEGLRVADAGAIAHAPRETYDRAFADDPPVGEEHAIAARWVTDLMTAAVLLAAHDAGWTVHALPGEPYALVSGTTCFHAGALLSAILHGDQPPERWTTATADLDLADLPLLAAGDADADAEPPDAEPRFTREPRDAEQPTAAPAQPSG
jgi:Zn-dependent protease with chaperone function